MPRVILSLGLCLVAAIVMGQDDAESKPRFDTVGRFSVTGIERRKREDLYDLELLLIDTETGQVWSTFRSTANQVFLGSRPRQTKWTRIKMPNEVVKRDGKKSGRFHLEAWRSGDKKRAVLTDTTTGDGWILTYETESVAERQSRSDDRENWGWQVIVRPEIPIED